MYWVKTNRVLLELDCDIRDTFVLQSCDYEDAIPPTSTLMPTETSYPTSTIPVWTPIASPTSGSMLSPTPPSSN